jgi:hypothetical protein
LVRFSWWNPGVSVSGGYTIDVTIPVWRQRVRRGSSHARRVASPSPAQADMRLAHVLSPRVSQPRSGAVAPRAVGGNGSFPADARVSRHSPRCAAPP